MGFLSALLADLGHPRRHPDPDMPLRDTPSDDPYTAKHTNFWYECGQLFFFEGGEVNWPVLAGVALLAAVAVALGAYWVRRQWTRRPYPERQSTV